MSYNKKVWKSGDRITKEALNNMENGIEAAHQNSGGSGTSYDDTAIKTDINTIKTDLGTEELTTTAKDVKGAVNEVNAQFKDIVKQINKFHLKIYSEDGTEHTLTISNNNELLLDGNKISQNTEKLENLLENRILVWHDEFNENSLNDKKWNIQIEGDDEPHRNNEAQAYLANNVSIDTINKNLVITAKKETYTGNSNISGEGIQTKTYNWTSGSINTNNKMEFLYGRLEMKAKLPCVAGTWPAFWLLNHMFPNGFYRKSWSVGGEIDIFEQYNTQQKVNVNLWKPTGNGCTSLGTASYSCNPTEWHIYAFEWTENKMEVFVDGNSYKAYDTSNITCNYNGKTYYPYKMAQQIKLNMALGSTAGACSDDTNGAEYRIDWIRLYAPDGYSKEISPNSITLDKNSLNMAVGDEDYIFATINPITATNQTIKWQSSDNTVATIADGYIKAIKKGKCNITASCNGNETSCVVSVSESIPCTNISLDEKNITITENTTKTLTYTLIPSNTTDKVVWQSDQPTKLSVNNGILTPYENGTYTITVACGNQTDTCTVTVDVDKYKVDIAQDYVEGQNIDLSKYNNNSAKYFTDGAASYSGDTLSLSSASDMITIEYVIDKLDINTSYQINVSFGGTYKVFAIYDENNTLMLESYLTNYAIIPKGFEKIRIKLYCANATTSYSNINIVPYNAKSYFDYNNNYTLKYDTVKPDIYVGKGCVKIKSKESKINSLSWIIDNLNSAVTYKLSATVQTTNPWMAIYKKDENGEYTTLVKEDATKITVSGEESYRIALYSLNGNDTLYTNVLFTAK